MSVDQGEEPSRIAPYAPWPYFDRDEIDAVAAILKSGKVNYWTGQEGREFEKEFASWVGAEYAIAVANGTVALELALYALGIGPGDEVIVPSRTFIASASCVVMRGATPVMVDVDSVSQNITVEAIRAALTPETRAIIAVHLAGWPCDMDPIMALAKEKGLAVIEDCAQAHGATYKGRPVGSIGHVGAWSFCQDKIMTTGGEGGMVATNDRALWARMWSYKDHGKSWEAVYECPHPPGFRWLHDSFGTNWRLTEMQAAIGRIQLRRLPDWIRQRRENARTLDEHFSRIPSLRVTRPHSDFGHAYYKYYTFIRPERIVPGWSRDRIVQAIQEEGIPCMPGICPEVYLEKAFESTKQRPAVRLPVAKGLGETSLMFLVHPTLQAEHMLQVCRVVEKVMRDATGQPK